MADDELEHAGVKGMKWGVRKNPNYTSQQRRRDGQIYGRGGVRRINNNMNKGDQVSTARGFEKGRRDRVMGRNKYARQGGKVAGAVVGVVGANVAINLATNAATSRIGQSVANKVLGQYGDLAVAAVAMANNPIIRVAASAGAARVGSMLAGDAAVSANMRVNGYDPNRR